MSAEPAPTAAARAAELVAELEQVLPGLAPLELLTVRAAIGRVAEAAIDRALGVALAGNGHDGRGAQALTVEEAAAHLRRSASWLHHNWRPLRIGFLDGGRLRFRRADLDRYLANCRGGRVERLAQDCRRLQLSGIVAPAALPRDPRAHARRSAAARPAPPGAQGPAPTLRAPLRVDRGGSMRTGICSICSRPDSDQIDQALVEGGTSRGVAQKFGLAKSSVSRHRANDLRKRLQAAARERGGAPGDHLLEEMESLNATARKILGKALKAGEHVTALAAIREARQTLMDQARLLGQLGGGGTTINIFGDPEAALRMAIAELQRRGYRVLDPGQRAIEASAVPALPALLDRAPERRES